MRFNPASAVEETEQIRRACAELGIDREMTELILGSHRRDRTLPASTGDEPEDLREYVRRKRATWERIFEGPIA